MRAIVNVDWVGPGAGPMEGLVAPNLPGGGATGQSIAVQSKTGGYVIVGTGTGGAIQNADVAALVALLSTDITAALEAAGPIGVMQGWPQGNP
jgi:hypothetical protein